MRITKNRLRSLIRGTVREVRELEAAELHESYENVGNRLERIMEPIHNIAFGLGVFSGDNAGYGEDGEFDDIPPHVRKTLSSYANELYDALTALETVGRMKGGKI